MNNLQKKYKTLKIIKQKYNLTINNDIQINMLFICSFYLSNWQRLLKDNIQYLIGHISTRPLYSTGRSAN